MEFPQYALTQEMLDMFSSGQLRIGMIRSSNLGAEAHDVLLRLLGKGGEELADPEVKEERQRIADAVAATLLERKGGGIHELSGLEKQVAEAVLRTLRNRAEWVLENLEWRRALESGVAVEEYVEGEFTSAEALEQALMDRANELFESRDHQKHCVGRTWLCQRAPLRTRVARELYRRREWRRRYG